MSQSQNDISGFLAFTQALTTSAQGNENVIGLVLVGSTAETFRADEWSDHDFFLIVKPGLGEQFRRNLSWLPDFSDIAFSPRETDHGLKVVYKNGQVLEFAVFEDSELELASVNSWAVPVDKANITSRVLAIRDRTKPRIYTVEEEWSLFLATTLIAIGRARRGELLIAGQGIRTRALNHALGLLRAARVPQADTVHCEDNLDRFRRVEVQFPREAKILNEISEMPVEDGARALLDFVLSLHILDERQISWANVVRSRLGWGVHEHETK
ncbi:MAG: hypothetical protein NTX12_04200 [Actinobacteria bacterium]|nr:hypothetical protein [Actinomycetota bacterium]